MNETFTLAHNETQKGRFDKQYSKRFQETSQECLPNYKEKERENGIPVKSPESKQPISAY